MKLSIIIPVYRTEATLHRCVESVLNQNLDDFEVILVDDGSPDNSPQICDDWAAKDAHIRVIHKPNGGLSNARNAGLDKAQGDYITFDTEFESSGDSIKGKALDRFGTVCLIEAMDETPAYDTYFVFSAQRETGGRGMMTAAYSIRPDMILIVDTPDAADVYRSEHVRARLGGGAVIEYMDRTNISDTSEVFSSQDKRQKGI